MLLVASGYDKPGRHSRLIRAQSVHKSSVFLTAKSRVKSLVFMRVAGGPDLEGFSDTAYKRLGPPIVG